MTLTRLCLTTMCMVVASAAMPAALAAQLELDATFSGNGHVWVGDANASLVTETDVRRDQVYALSLDLVPSAAAVAVSRLNSDGTHDAGYGSAGSARVPVKGAFAAGFTVDRFGASVAVAQSAQALTVVAWNSSGRLDRTFSSNGIRRLAVPGQQGSSDPDVVIDRRGRLVVAAMVPARRGSKVNVYRLLPDGSLDLSFSGDGVRVVDNGRWDWMDALAIDGNRVVLGTDTGGAGDLNAAGAVMRLRRNGANDSTFSEDGLAHFRLMPGRFTFPVAIGVGASGRLTLAATSATNLYGAVRIRPNGTLDASFGDAGVVGVTCNCFVYNGDVSAGRVALVGNRKDGTTLVTRITKHGTRLDQGWLDPFPATRSESPQAIAWSGTKMVLGGSVRQRGFVARVA